MTLNYGELLNLIKKANRLGAQGIMVVDIVPPQSATSIDTTFIIDTNPDRNLTASELPWYLKY